MSPNLTIFIAVFVVAVAFFVWSCFRRFRWYFWAGPKTASRIWVSVSGVCCIMLLGSGVQSPTDTVLV